MGWTQTGSQFVYISPSNGLILVYSGVPANGNLSVAIAAASGTDQFGNSYPAGLSAFGTTNQASPGLSMPINSPDLALNAFINSYEENSGLATEYFATEYVGPIMSGQGDEAQLALFSNEKGGGSPAQGALIYDSAAAVQYNPLIWTNVGCTIIANLITANHPGATVPTAETWQSLGSAGAATFIQDFGRYRMTPEGECEIDILFQSNANPSTAGTFAFANTLPSAYQFSGNIDRVYPLGANDAAAIPAGCVLIDGNGTGAPGRVRAVLPALPQTAWCGASFSYPLS